MGGLFCHYPGPAVVTAARLELAGIRVRPSFRLIHQFAPLRLSVPPRTGVVINASCR
jgi:hypothetical protein